ncbi:MAG TPA: BamA/TamA family outer membrane protein [Flavipsychrobacter sp.]|nr:BamA/TamA family outer membrane protein [Flavipsychrobacter sp.]
MAFRSSTFNNILLLVSLLLLSIAGTSCDPTKHLTEEQYLLRKNNIKLTTDKGITRRGELKDNVERLIVQKTNTYFLGVPYKVWLYNLRYEKYKKDSIQSKLIERPVVFDSSLVTRSVNNIRSYLFNQGYFNPIVDDTIKLKGQKAYVDYIVTTGNNYLIRKTTLDVDDSTIKSIVKSSMGESALQEGKEFSMSLLEEERSRITNVLRDHGYYKFTQENVVNFSLDTFNKELLRDVDNPFESAINFLAAQKTDKKPTLDVNIIIRAENKDAYKPYVINKVSVFPDFENRTDMRDSSMYHSLINGVSFRYHNHYVRENVILKYVYLEHGKRFSQTDFDATINRLNQLGVFQTVRIFLSEDTTGTDSSTNLLNAYILMTPAKKLEFTGTVEVSTGMTYALGVMPGISFRNHNLGKGANLLTASASFGAESAYNPHEGKTFFQHFSLLTKTYSLNASIDFPKFLSPFRIRSTKKNLPRTVVSFGTSWLDRLNYFTLTNTSANFAYNWRETSTNTWDLSPAFVSIIRLPKVSDSFQRRLEENDFLKNSYRETFIEGESVGFTFSNQSDNKGHSYSYARVSAEEAGGLLGGLSAIGLLNNLNYAQYLKFDFDTRRYINRRRSQIALRFYGGVGIPYGASPTLPYIKQYFVGGAYSIRGWRIRTLGPGSYFDTTAESTTNFIDRTGDIKLEMNAEYRFDIIQLFSGAIKLRGATFADAGNIWLMKDSKDYPGGVFRLNKLGDDIAISAGAGLRMDIAGFFILRFDGAFPVKVPYNATYDRRRWINPFDGHWGISDIVLNIAVGYPF